MALSTWLCSTPQQGASEARRATAAVDAEFGGGEGADIESGATKACVGFLIFFDGEQAIVSQGKDVAGEGVALGGIDFDEFEAARFQEFYGFDREPGEIDQSGVIVEQADQGHQMQAGGGAGTMGERGRENLHSFRSEQVVELANTGGIRAIAVTDEESLGIEPEDVSGFGGAGRSDLAESGNVDRLAERGVVRAFDQPVRLAGTHHEQTVIGGKRRVVGVDGVEGEAWDRGHFDDFCSGGFQLAAESCVLGLSAFEIGGVLES